MFSQANDLAIMSIEVGCCKTIERPVCDDTNEKYRKAETETKFKIKSHSSF